MNTHPYHGAFAASLKQNHRCATDALVGWAHLELTTECLQVWYV